MDDLTSRRAPADDLDFLGDLDRGLDLKPEYGGPRPGRPAQQPAAPAATPVAPDGAGPDRHRPLLDLFPLSTASTSAASRTPTPSQPLLAPPPAIEQPEPVAPAADDDLSLGDMFDGAGPGRAKPADDDDLTEEIFGNLREKPFSAVPDLRFLYHSRAHDRAMQALLTAIGQHDSCVVLTGDAGTGKSMACRAVLDQIDHHTFTSFIDKSFLTMEDLLKAILTDFGVISRVDLEGGTLEAATQGQLTVALHEFLLSLSQIKGFAIAVIDDAHTLPQTLLDELRNLTEAHPRLFGVVFVGSRELLAKTSRRQQPGAAAGSAPLRVRLETLAEDEIRGYVSHRLAIGETGGTGIDFADAALALLYNASGGVPRVINQVAERALALAAEQSTGYIDPALIEAAMGELNLIPPEPIATRFMYDLAVAGGLLVLLLIGAAAGAFVFRAQVRQVISAWTAPPASAAPATAAPAPPRTE